MSQRYVILFPAFDHSLLLAVTKGISWILQILIFNSDVQPHQPCKDSFPYPLCNYKESDPLWLQDHVNSPGI